MLDNQWKISYPYSISKAETETVSVVLLNSSLSNSSIPVEESECDIAIEVLLDVSGMVISPGSKIIEPYRVGSPLRFDWSIKALENDVSGTIWIYILSGENGEQLSRYPLFAVPVEIKTNSFMGISPRFFRFLLFSLIIIITGIYFLQKTNYRE